MELLTGAVLHPRAWSWAAVALCVAAEGAALAVIFGPGQDPAEIRWPLVVLPLVLATVAVLVPQRATRVAAAVAMAAWCVLASASIGLFFVPSLIAMLFASRA